MSNRELPTMPWYPDQFAASTRHWTWEERALYRDMLDLQWQLGVLPDDEKRLSSAIRLHLRRFRRLWKRVGEKFDPVEGGLQNYRLEQHRLAGLSYKESKRLGAHITNEKRWGKPYIKESLSEKSANRSGIAQRVADESPPSPSPEEEYSVPLERLLPGERNGSAHDPRSDKKNTPPPDSEALRERARTLSSTGLKVGDIARMLSQYHVTVAQVRQWVGAERHT